MTKYLFDANIWIDANYKASVKMFPTTLWARFRTEIESGNIIILKAVYDEVTKSSDDLSKWLQQFKSFVYNHLHDENLLLEAKKIINTYPSIVDPRNPNDQADPYLIAYAVKYKPILVTNEKAKTGKVNIPSICNDYKIEFTSLEEFYDKVNWFF